MIVFEKGVQQSYKWFWKKVNPGDFITFSCDGTSCMKIFDSNNEEVEKIIFGYEKNRLTFDNDTDSNINLIVLIEDYSNLPSGFYTYDINVESLIDDSMVKDSGELEIRDA